MNAKIMQRFARWHIWLGWAIAVPLVMWTLTGLVMVARPIEQVRGDHLRLPVEERALPADVRARSLCRPTRRVRFARSPPRSSAGPPSPASPISTAVANAFAPMAANWRR